jgi:hypothetical protein
VVTSQAALADHIKLGISTREVAMPLQLSDLHLTQDPTRPVHTALSRVCLDSFNEAADAMSEAMAVAERRATMPHAEAELKVMRLFETVARSLTTVNELMDWVYLSPGRPMPFQKALNEALALRELGAEPADVQAILSGLQKRPVGRPHQRQVFMKAYEFQLQSESNTQGKATRMFCPCGQKIHTARCEQNLKAGMRGLKKVLRRYAPDLVSRYEVLHPNRDKKVNG